MTVEEKDRVIEELKKENDDLEKTIDNSLEEQKERDKYTHSLEEKYEKLQQENEKLKRDLAFYKEIAMKGGE